ncbi:related to pisatin demethylase (cytochrome P450) [Phialocephala subalpina]|uniref:Related to pisatin demethylase (Cytochrome P450) n=1 Tax=Phialocephala subalpina TaxID=576137 RepID=A0A1L7XQY6_9HELO|nr:related to pisatin demethylase (cytochrome P450) [Phialocephala subalpina]
MDLASVLRSLHELYVAFFSSPFTFIGTVVGYFIVVQYLSYRRLAHIPGPRLAACSNLWLVRAIWGQQSHLDVYEVSKQYGPLTRIGPNDLITTDVGLIHRIQAARSPYKRSRWYRGFRLAPGIDNVLSQTDDKLHTKRRAQLSLGFSLHNQESIIDRHVANLIALLRTKYLSNEEQIKIVDLAEKLQFFALDVVMDIATGSPFGDLVHDEDRYEYLKSTADSLPAIAMVSSVPWAGKLLQSKYIARLIAPKASEYGIGKIVDIASKMVAARIDDKSKADGEDMLSHFLSAGITPTECIYESMIAILGGSDTMSIALRSVMLFTITNPRVYNILVSSILEFSTYLPPGLMISSTNLKRVPYLQAVIKESLRIFPPGTGQMPKMAPREGDTLNGIKIPAWTNVGTNPWFIMRDPANFGPDAEMFRPERWLEADEKRLKEMNYVWELVWGYGKYQCLGKQIAEMELGKVVFELLRHFEWEIVDPTKPMESRNVGIWIQKGMNVRVTERALDASREK